MKATTLRALFRVASRRSIEVERLVLSNACPICRQAPGKDCRDSNGYVGLAPRTHAGRLLLIPERTRIMLSLNVLDRIETEALDGDLLAGQEFGGSVDAMLRQIRHDRESLLRRLPLRASAP